MSYIILGTATQLQIKVPVNGFTDWGDVMRTDTFLKIAQHLHTGLGDGSQLGTSSFLANAITGAKFRLDNDEELRARNNADDADIDILKVNTSDRVEIYDVDLIQAKQVTADSSVTLADNQAVAATTTILTLGALETAEIHYALNRNSVIQEGVLKLDGSTDLISEVFTGSDNGITFSLNSGVLEYVSTSTGNTTSMTYVIIKK